MGLELTCSSQATHGGEQDLCAWGLELANLLSYFAPMEFYTRGFSRHCAPNNGVDMCFLYRAIHYQGQPDVSDLTPDVDLPMYKTFTKVHITSGEAIHYFSERA